jgi:ribonucleoside-triphosphate reductase
VKRDCKGAEFITELTLYDKYARWIPEKSRRETWAEVTSRVTQWLQKAPGAKKIPGSVWSNLHDAILRKDVLPSMRIVQMAGPSLDRCNVGAYNCAYTVLQGPRDLAELLYILMQGTGVGYSVERTHVSQWPKVKDRDSHTDDIYVIDDSTEGWADAFKQRLVDALDGVKRQYDYSQIRPEGEWLHTKGGRASGPKPLRDLLDKSWDIIRARRGQALRPLDVHRLATMCGSIVQVGGVRRAAEIALFDADDQEMLSAKNGKFWEVMPELAMANNSMVATGPVKDSDLLSWMAQLAGNGTGEPGVFRRDGAVPQRRAVRDDFGTNPCGEIILRPRQFCNLSIAVARPDDTTQTLEHKVNLAAILGTIQSTLTNFSYLSPEWKANCDEERLLGVDITGACDCPLLCDPHTTPRLLGHLKDVAVEVNKGWAALLGVAASAAVTCNKPSGNSAQFLDTSSGIHARYAPYYVRRLRVAARSPIGLHLRDRGLPVFPETAQGTLEEAQQWVVELPVKSPDGAIVRDQLSALDQLSYWLMWKKCWTEHNPSCTIYVHPDEWVGVTSFLRMSWDAIGGLSFLPKDTNIYPLAPYEEITKDEYERRLAVLPAALDLHLIQETQDITTVNSEFACVGGLCEI